MGWNIEFSSSLKLRSFGSVAATDDNFRCLSRQFHNDGSGGPIGPLSFSRHEKLAAIPRTANLL